MEDDGRNRADLRHKFMAEHGVQQQPFVSRMRCNFRGYGYRPVPSTTRCLCSAVITASFSKNNPFGDPSSCCWDFFRREEMTRAMERNFVSHRGMKYLVPFDPLNAHRSKVRFKEIELKIKKGKFSFVSFVIGKIIIYISQIKYLRNFFFSLRDS